jgi:hypothetical protein
MPPRHTPSLKLKAQFFLYFYCTFARPNVLDLFASPAGPGVKNGWMGLMDGIDGWD